MTHLITSSLAITSASSTSTASLQSVTCSYRLRIAIASVHTDFSFFASSCRQDRAAKMAKETPSAEEYGRLKTWPGWVTNVLQRHNFINVKLAGEAGDVDLIAAAEAMQIFRSCCSLRYLSTYVHVHLFASTRAYARTRTRTRTRMILHKI